MAPDGQTPVFGVFHGFLPFGHRTRGNGRLSRIAGHASRSKLQDSRVVYHASRRNYRTSRSVIGLPAWSVALPARNYMRPWAYNFHPGWPSTLPVSPVTVPGGIFIRP